MQKLYLAVSVLAFGTVFGTSQPHAALRTGVTYAMPRVTGDGSHPPCRYCNTYQAPQRGGSAYLNPQPLPPGIVGNDRMLRR